MLKKTHTFLLKLSQNNNRDWFHANKGEYDLARTEFLEFTDQLLIAMRDFEDLGMVTAKHCMYRINRDVRFSPDKTPYNTHFSALISNEGRKTRRACYYFKIKPDGESFIVGGMGKERAAVMSAVRQELDYNLDQFIRIVNKDEFVKKFGEVRGESLKRPPRGYSPDHPGISYLMKKEFLVFRDIDKSLYTSPGLMDEIITCFKTMKPFLDFLNVPLEEYFSQED